jgi:hypothetical protein
MFLLMLVYVDDAFYIGVSAGEAYVALPTLYSGYHEADILFTHRRVREILFGYIDEILKKIPGQDPWYPGLVFNQSYSGALVGPRFTMMTGESMDQLILLLIE